VKPEAKTIVDEISDFIGRYLHCSEHERNTLALWLLHTHCFSAAQVTPYISIQSVQKQSGKTLCLQLLSLLCPNPALTSSVTAAVLSKRTDAAERPTFLLDESQITLGNRSRSKNPTLRGLLVSGFQRGIGASDKTRERNLFSPKAFAGIGILPEPLAERSLPIILEPLNGASTRKRFNLARAQEEVKPLREKLESWAKEHLPALEKAQPYEPEQFPPGLTPRRQDMIEPLLQLADALGGPWPERARQTFLGLFKDQIAKQSKMSLQLLSDIRDAFIHYGLPARLSTAALLTYLQTLPNRPWNQDGPLKAQTLAAMLQVFRVQPRSQRIKRSAEFSSPHRGYAARDFVLLWARYLDPVGGYPGTEAEAEQWCTAEERGQLLALEQMAARDQEKGKAAAVTTDAAGSRAASVADEPNRSRSTEGGSSGLERSDTNERKTSNDAGCSNVATSPQDSEVEFIPSAVRTKLVPSEARVAG
jgi:hypothetical protein